MRIRKPPARRRLAVLVGAALVTAALGLPPAVAQDQRESEAKLFYDQQKEEHRLAVIALADETQGKAALTRLGDPKLAAALEKLGTIFGAYGEWGQPIHGVGNDVRILGLPIRRPSTAHAFRMLCRHNRYVQQYGRVKDADGTVERISVKSGTSMPRSR